MTAFSFATAQQKLSKLGQEHLLKFWGELSKQQQERLLQQIERLDPATLEALCIEFHKTIDTFSYSLEPVQDYFERGDPLDISYGKQLLEKGLCGCILVAGGQGTRLKFDGPKGMYPVSLIRKKTLFQLFAEKTVAAGKQVGCRLPLAVMTSPANRAETVNYFAEHSNFGLHDDQLYFFSQGMLPLFDEHENLFLSSIDSVAEGADGNGSSLHHFVSSGLWDVWQTRGVEYVNYVLVDNPLADPFDANLFGFHARQNNQITVKACRRKDLSEKVGMPVKNRGHLEVIEYSEMPEEERLSVNADGIAKYPIANLSLFCFSMDPLKSLAERYQEMPLHKAHKAVKFIDDEGRPVEPKRPNSWKFERFIFDVLPFAQNVQILLFPRQECFSPLKNAEGEGSPARLAEALQACDRAVFEHMTGNPPLQRPFELSQEFYYPTASHLKKWRGASLPPEGYIEV